MNYLVCTVQGVLHSDLFDITLAKFALDHIFVSNHASYINRISVAPPCRVFLFAILTSELKVPHGSLPPASPCEFFTRYDHADHMDLEHLEQ